MDIRDEASSRELTPRSYGRCEWLTKARLCAALLGLALAACSDPHFRDPDDAGASMEEPVPELLAEALVGSYVVRTDSFTEDNLLITRAREIALVEITESAGKLELSARTCAWSANNGWGSMKLMDPAAFPTRLQKIVFEQGRWRTLPLPVPVGYSTLPPDACEGAAGRRVRKQPGQDWLTDTCSCPPDADFLPGLEDCRVTDPDGDGQPGITYDIKALEQPAKVHFVRELSFKYVDGTISATGRHTAREEQIEQMRQLSCNFASCLQVGQLSHACP
ncbi:MAG TPA: hypothetical protein VMF89_26445, partial [Polyangiales bacterium]|nr:hypothetical protein [Polyangiales bacterium]